MILIFMTQLLNMKDNKYNVKIIKYQDYSKEWTQYTRIFLLTLPALSSGRVRGGCIKVRIQIKPKYKLNPAKPFKSELIFNSSPIWDNTQIEKWLKTIIRGTGLVKAQFDINIFS